MLLDATPTTRFLGKCEDCVYPFGQEITDARTDTREADCPRCGGPVTLERIYGTRSAEPCDPRCMGASSPSCSCACGGDNHGRLMVIREDMTASELAAHYKAVERYQAGAAKRAEAARKRREAKAAEARAAFDLWADDNRDVVGFLAQTFDEYRDSFLWEMSLAVARRTILTERQAAAVLRCKAGREKYERIVAEREANAKPCPEGKALEITGRIVKTWYEDNTHGPGGRSLMTVECDGYMVRSTIPRALITEIRGGTDGDPYGIKGKTVRFVADVQQGNRSASYGFAKRPRRATLV